MKTKGKTYPKKRQPMNLGRLVHSQAYAHTTYTVGVRIWERLLLSLSVIFCFWSSVFLKENKKWRG